jgi:glycosyltransferase involved in cell wall biosynthesis
MRVALVCGSYVPDRDGVADYVRRLAQALPGAGVTPVITTGGRSETGAVPVAAGWSARGTWQAAGALHALSVDLVHVQWSPSAYGFRPGIGLLPVRLRTPLITTIHEYDWWSWPRRVPTAAWQWLERRRWWDRESGLLGPRSDALVVTNDAHAAAVRNRLGRDAHLIPIGPNVDGPTPDAARAAEAIRRRLKLPSGATLLVTFGFVHPVKGVRQLIDAVTLLRENGRNVRLVVAGGFTSLALPEDEAAAFRAELEQRIDAASLQAAVTFTGYLDAAAVSALLSAADAIVLPFTAGVTTKSGALLAALSHARPVLATAADVPDPDLVDGETVLVIRQRRDPAAIAAAVTRLLDDPRLAARVAAAGAQLGRSRSWQGLAAAHAELYRSVLENGGR